MILKFLFNKFIFTSQKSINTVLHGQKSKFKTYLRTWLVQTITGDWECSKFSLTWSTVWTHIQVPSCFWSRNNRMHDRSFSDCVTVWRIQFSSSKSIFNWIGAQIMWRYYFDEMFLKRLCAFLESNYFNTIKSLIHWKVSIIRYQNFIKFYWK